VFHLVDFKQRFYFLLIALFLLGAGNALAIATHLGSAVWTGTTVNLAHVFHAQLGNTLFVFGIVVTLLNQLLLGHFDRRRLISNILFTLPFSYLVAAFTVFWQWLGVGQLNLPVRLILDTLGIVIVGTGGSIYQRANLILHPTDDLAYIIRFKYLNGSATFGQWASYIPPLLLLVFCGFWLKRLDAIGYGTVVALLVQGSIVAWADHHIFTSLKQHVDVVAHR
jgi:uncharacterized membrane protein YczE